MRSTPSTFWSNVRIVANTLPRPRYWPMIARMATAYGKVVLLNRRPFRFFDVALDYRCNLSCTHCSALPMIRPDEQTLTHDDYRRFVGEAMRFGTLAFHLTGGEPLMRKDLFELIPIFKPAWNMVSIQTNGMALTDSMVRRLREAGIRMICVSLDSADRDEHDRFRDHTGCYDAALAGLDRATAAGIPCAVSICVSHENLRSDDIRALIRLIEARGLRGFLNLAVPIGHWAGRHDVMMTPDDRLYINDLIRQYPFLRTDFESNWKERGCPAFKEKAYLSPYGDVLPCPFIQVSYGNIRRQTLSSIIERGRAAPEYQGYTPRCLAAEDRDFVTKFRCYEKSSISLPVLRSEAMITPGAPPSACSMSDAPTSHETCQTL